MSQAASAALEPRRSFGPLTPDGLVRRVHLVLGGAFWTTFTLTREPSLRAAIVGAVLGACWSACLGATALQRAPYLRARAWTLVQFAGATVLFLAGALAVSTAIDLRLAPLELAAGVVQMGAVAFLWEAYLAGALGLTRPLRCLLVGSPSTARLLLREPLAPGARPFELVGLITDGPGEVPAEGLPVLGSADELEAILARTPCDLVVIGARTGRPAVFARLLGVSHLGLQLVELPEFFEREFGRVPVEEITSVWFLQALNRARGGPDAVVKRVLDVTVALVVGVLTAPLMAAAAVGVRLTSPGPILYRQLRVGEHGRPYWVLKFRSMRVDAEADGAVWAQSDDPRTTSIGKHLRRFRIDELPQLLNVLRGDMTMVGPRPERPEFVEDLVEQVPFYEPRHMTKPGLTGWAQVTAGYAATLDDSRLKLSYDLYYLKHRSLALDLTILLRTVGVVLRGTGAR